MASRRILLTGSLPPNTIPVFETACPEHEVLEIKDGARLVSVVARLIKAQRPPKLIVIVPELRRISAVSSIRAIRALERAAGWHTTPILFYAEDSAELQADLKSVGMAVNLVRNTQLPENEQISRLALATGRLVTKIGG